MVNHPHLPYIPALHNHNGNASSSVKSLKHLMGLFHSMPYSTALWFYSDLPFSYHQLDLLFLTAKKHLYLEKHASTRTQGNPPPSFPQPTVFM